MAVASHSSPTWTGAIHGRVLEGEIIGAATFALHTAPSGLAVHVANKSIFGAQLRRALEALYRGINGPISHFINQHALNLVVEGLCLLPCRVGGKARTSRRSRWSSRILVRLTQRPRHYTSCCPTNTSPSWCLMRMGCWNLMCLPCTPSSKWLMRRGTRWQRAQGPTRRWLVLVKLCPWEWCIMALHIRTYYERETAGHTQELNRLRHTPFTLPVKLQGHTSNTLVRVTFRLLTAGHHHLWWECGGRCCVVCPWKRHEGVRALFGCHTQSL